MTMTDEETQSLLERWRSGDQAAVDALLSEVLPWLHREMSKELGNQPRAAHDSMDLAQTAVLNFLKRGVRFVPETPTQFRALLKRIAFNELRDQWRRQKRAGGGRHLDSLVNSANPLSGFGSPGGTSLTPSRQAERSEDGEWVRLALQFLREEDRWLLLASEVEGLDWAAVAAELELSSADAARMKAARLKPRLANVLRKLRSGRIPEDH
jgi:RNA polymerase sigma factor (sigma-70 family)